jgi:hypothetical protein
VDDHTAAEGPELGEVEEILNDPDAELTELERNWLINWLASNDIAAS